MTTEELTAGLHALANRYSDQIAEWEAFEAARKKQRLPALGMPHIACADVLAGCVRDLYELLARCEPATIGDEGDG